MAKSLLPIDLIIFDLDGTLVDSKKDIANAVNNDLGG
jgi:phosphoglycolate phosphatase-like HAD superfamily hydrolase